MPAPAMLVRIHLGRSPRGRMCAYDMHETLVHPTPANGELSEPCLSCRCSSLAGGGGQIPSRS